MKNLKEKVAAILQAFDGSTLRQRIIVATAIFAGIYAAWDNWFYQPMLVKNQAIESAISTANNEINTYNKLLSQLAIDPDDESRFQIETLLEQIAHVDSEIQLASDELIAPNQMPEVLQQLLTKNQNLRVTQFTTEPPSIIRPIVSTPDENGVENGDNNDSDHFIYKHKMLLGFEGDYLSALNYIHSVEQMAWRIFWDSVQIDSTEYPRTRVSISLYTLSLSEGWIGV